MRTLIVDDSKTMRSIYAAVLAQLGHTDVAEACDGLDALSRVGSFQPDLILVDWTMPNMDGLTMVRQYRARGGDARIIMLASGAEHGRLAEAVRAGADALIGKPFTPDVLSQRIEETLARSAA